MDYSSNANFARDIIPTIPNQGIEITPQTIENLKAIANPQQAIDDRQAQQVAGAVSGLIAKDMEPDLANATLKEIEELRVESEKMLKENTGARRLAYTPEQKVALNNKRQKIQANIEWGQYITKANTKAIEDFQQGIRSGVLDASDAAAFNKILEDQKNTARTKGLAYMEDPTKLVGFLMEKKAAEKKSAEYDKWRSEGLKVQDKYGNYDEKVGYEAQLGRVKYMGNGYAERILGLPSGTFTTSEQAATALNESLKEQKKRMSRGGGSSTAPVPLDEGLYEGVKSISVANLGKTWSGKVKVGDKEVILDNMDVTRVLQDGRIVVNVPVPNPEYDQYMNSNKPKTILEEQVVSDDRGTYKSVEKAKQLPSDWPTGSEKAPQTNKGKTYKMSDAKAKYKGYSEQQIREKLSAAGYTEVK